MKGWRAAGTGEQVKTTGAEMVEICGEKYEEEKEIEGANQKGENNHDQIDR